MKITKRQLRRIIKEEKARILEALNEDDLDLWSPSSGGDKDNGHHWPRVDWKDANELVDKWIDMEKKAFDPGDPSMNDDGNLSTTDAKSWWSDQVDSASMDMENELVERLRKTALKTMQEFTEKLINGEYA